MGTHMPGILVTNWHLIYPLIAGGRGILPPGPPPPSTLLFTSTLCLAPSALLPSPNLWPPPQPGSDMAFVFLPGCSLSGHKGLCVWDLGTPIVQGSLRGGFGKSDGGSPNKCLLSPPTATLHALPLAWIPHGSAAPRAVEEAPAFLGPCLRRGRGGNRAENVPSGERGGVGAGSHSAEGRRFPCTPPSFCQYQLWGHLGGGGFL